MKIKNIALLILAEIIIIAGIVFSYSNQYVYERVRKDGMYDIRFDSSTKNIADDIAVEFPSKKYRIRLFNTQCIVSFESALSGAEQTQLNTVIQTHKNK